MRIPYFISKNTRIAYETSEETQQLKYEQNRELLPEVLEFGDDFMPTLVELCVKAICKYFKDKPYLQELPCADREHLLEILPLDLPLEMVIPLIDEEYYWERRYLSEFGQFNKRKHVEWTWKKSYMERYVRKVVEEAQPQYADEDLMDEFLTLLSPYITTLIVTQLQPWKPPLYYEPEEIPEVWPIQHINFESIFRNLQNLIEVDITFGLKDIWEDYKPSMFEVSVKDIMHLGKAVLNLPEIKILRIHRSSIEDDHIQALTKSLIDNKTLVELDLSHCLIKDRGCLCIAKMMLLHPTLEILRLTNNRIGPEGGKGLGFAMMQEFCCPLRVLDLRLNPLFHEGTMGILRCLVRTHKLTELNIAAVLFEDDTPKRIGQMIGLNESLKKLDISSNYFDEEGAAALLKGFQTNKTLEWLDMRECDLEDYVVAKVNKHLLRNRSGVDEDEDDEDELKEELETDENTEEEKSLDETVEEENLEESDEVKYAYLLEDLDLVKSKHIIETKESSEDSLYN